MPETGIKQFFNDPHSLDAVIGKYPWFTTARMRRSVLTAAADPILALTLQVKPWPPVMLGEEAFDYTEPPLPDEPAADPTGEIIDRFLAGGAKRIVPTDDTPTGDVSEDSSVFVPDEELDTGELERIYRDQGLELMNDDVSDITGEVLGIVDDE